MRRTAPRLAVLRAALVVSLAGLASALLVVAPASGAPASGAPVTVSTRTVTYCTDGGEALPMTIYAPAHRVRLAPAVLQVHGGGWEIGHRIERLSASPTAAALVAHGFVVASIGYRLAPRYPWPAQIEDTACAIRFLRAHASELGIAPRRIGAWGSSAGGQLVSLLGTAWRNPAFDTGANPAVSSRPDAVVDGFGPADLASLGWSRFMRTIVRTVFGVPAGQPSARLRQASPIDAVAPGDPPFLVLQGTADRIVPPTQSVAFAARLEAAGVPVRLVLVRGGQHGLETPGEVPSAKWLSAEVVRFFERTLDPHPRPPTPGPRARRSARLSSGRSSRRAPRSGPGPARRGSAGAG